LKTQWGCKRRHFQSSGNENCGISGIGFRKSRFDWMICVADERISIIFSFGWMAGSEKGKPEFPVVVNFSPKSEN
jgi:hypothetical protein